MTQMSVHSVYKQMMPNKVYPQMGYDPPPESNEVIVRATRWMNFICGDRRREWLLMWLDF